MTKTVIATTATDRGMPASARGATNVASASPQTILVRMPLKIRTIRDAAEEGYRFAVECKKCGRSEFVDPAELVQQGHGDKLISADFRCRGCGHVADARLHPPSPKR